MAKAKAKPKEEQIYRQAVRFEVASQILEQITAQSAMDAQGIPLNLLREPEPMLAKDFDDHAPPTLIPWIICDAFIVELYFKALLTIEKTPFPPGSDGHNLKELFKRLDDKSQARIKECYAKCLPQCKEFVELRARLGKDTLFDTVLTEAKEAYHKWRYIFQFDPTGVALKLLKWPTSIYIGEVKPEWKGIFKTMVARKKRPPPIWQIPCRSPTGLILPLNVTQVLNIPIIGTLPPAKGS